MIITKAIQMNSSRIIVLMTITMMVMLFLIPTQSMPTRQKRWTFNTWRLHGRRYVPPTSINSPSESRLTSNTPDEHFNLDIDDNDSYVMLFRLLQFFQMLEREQKAQNNENMYFSKDLNA